MITISLKYVLVCLVLAALLALLIILCVVGVRLITTVKELNKVLEDASVVSDIAANTANQVDGIVTNVGATASRFRAGTEDDSVLGVVSNVARAVYSVAGRGKKSDDEVPKQRKRRSRR